MKTIGNPTYLSFPVNGKRNRLIKPIGFNDPGCAVFGVYSTLDVAKKVVKLHIKKNYEEKFKMQKTMYSSAIYGFYSEDSDLVFEIREADLIQS